MIDFAANVLVRKDSELTFVRKTILNPLASLPFIKFPKFNSAYFLKSRVIITITRLDARHSIQLQLSRIFISIFMYCGGDLFKI